MENLLLDVRHAIRGLRSSPVFTAVGLLTLALGIGANVVVFGVLNAVLLQPLEVSDPASLYQIRHKPWASFRLLTTSYPAFEDFRQRNTTFSGLVAIYGYSGGGLVWRNTVTKVHGNEVSGDYFKLLGVQPEVGRFFDAADEHGPSSAPYVVLSNALWRSVFGADPDVIGTTVELNKQPFTVVGVTQAQFHGTERFVWPDYWIPMANEEQVEGGWDYLHDRQRTSVTVIGRLKPGVTPQQATENLNAIAFDLAKEYPETDQGVSLRLIHPGLFGDNGDVIRGFLYGVTVLALLVLAAACANLASLFAARTSDRRRELALRMALGSSRGRLVRQLLTEAVVLSLIGGAAGLASATVVLGVLSRWHSPYGDLPMSVDARVYLAGVALTLGSAVLFGIVPARQVWQSSPLQMIKGGPVAVLHGRRLALRDLLLGAQVAICTLLVTASLVGVRGLLRLLDTPLGIRPQGAMLADMDVRQAGLESLSLQKQKEMLEALHAIPGVTAAGAVSRTPMSGGIRGTPVYRQGTTELTPNTQVLAAYVFSMSPGYLAAAGTRLLDGRDVSWLDTPSRPLVAIVNETFARRMWGETPAIGQSFLLRGNLTEVVGVAEDGKYHDLTEPPQAAAYVPFSQGEEGEGVFVVRSQRAPSETAAALRSALGAIEPNVPIDLRSWPDALGYHLFPARAATVALGIMGLLAAMLALTGIFGMAAYSVSRRMKELGIRVALGARQTQVMAAAVGRPMVLLGAGSVLGLLMGIPARRLLGQIVHQANPSDPVVVAGTVMTMALLGLVASALPARRAIAVDPSDLLRDE